MIFSKEFSKVIDCIEKSKLENEVTDFILELMEGIEYDVDFNVDFVDCEPDSNDMISFISNKKLKKLYKEVEKDETFESFFKKLKNDKDFWKSEDRTKIKIGRFKGFNALNKDNSNFEVVKGEDIRKYYLYTNYQNTKGQLGESCMRFKKCQEFLDIYVDNPKICKLLILKGDKDKITGRALIWKTTSGEMYLDRVYTNNDSDIILFNAYAKKKLGCKYSYDEIFSYDSEYTELSIKPNKIDFKKYPYMDTFRFLFKDKGLLYTAPIDSQEHYYELEMTHGVIE